MHETELEGFIVVGLSERVRNDQPSAIGALWTRFYQSNVMKRLPDAKSPDVHCVYHDYEGGHSDPFQMTIGYRVNQICDAPEGLHRVFIPKQKVATFEVNGPQPQSLVAQWQEVWQSELKRAYAADFDVYDSKDESRVVVSVGVVS